MPGRTLVVAIALVVTALFASADAPRAQCVPFGTPCASSGMQLICGSAPVVGQNWTIGERGSSTCGNPTQMATIFGLCQTVGIPIDPPIACATCGGCQLHAYPSDFALQWNWPPRLTTVRIPNDPRLVGVSFCIQNACFGSSCVCLSQTMQVTLQ